MLKLLALPLLFISSLAIADEAKYKLPAGIKCENQAKDESVRNFTIKKLDTARPEISIPDAPLIDPIEPTYNVSISFSSMCESAYGVTLFGSDLEELRAGKVKSVKGLLNYSNPNLDEIVNGGEESVQETVVITCTLLK